MDDDEVVSWRIRKEWHAQDMSHPRRMRYMTDVRHPLKYMGDDRPVGDSHSPGPFWKGKMTSLPREGTCPLCGRTFSLNSPHGCFRSLRFRR